MKFIILLIMSIFLLWLNYRQLGIVGRYIKDSCAKVRLDGSCQRNFQQMIKVCYINWYTCFIISSLWIWKFWVHYVNKQINKSIKALIWDQQWCTLTLGGGEVFINHVQSNMDVKMILFEALHTWCTLAWTCAPISRSTPSAHATICVHAHVYPPYEGMHVPLEYLKTSTTQDWRHLWSQENK